MGESRNLPCRRIPNNLCSYSTLKEGEHNSPQLRCELCIPNTTAWERGVSISSNSTVERPVIHYLSQMIEINTNSHKSC